MRAAACRAPAGFSVIEVLVAVMLLTMGLIATAQLVMFSSGQSALGTQMSTASTLAAQTVESYRDRDFLTITPGTVVTTSVVGPTVYTVTTVVTTNDPAANMARIHVTVTWGGGGQTYVTETILSQLGSANVRRHHATVSRVGDGRPDGPAAMGSPVG